MGDTGWLTALRRLPLAFSRRRSATLPVLLTARSWWLFGFLVTVAVTASWPLAGFLEGSVEGWGVLLLSVLAICGVSSVALAISIARGALPGSSPTAIASAFWQRSVMSSRLGAVEALLGAYLAMRDLGPLPLIVGSGCAALILTLSIPSRRAIERHERKAAASGQPIDLADILASTPAPAPGKESPRWRSRGDNANQ